MSIKNEIKNYIKEELSKLHYINDEVSLKNVYPAIIEEVIGDFDKPYELNGYDCDYWAKTDTYSIDGCMRSGTATIILIKGEKGSNADKEVIVPKSEKEDYTIPKEGSENFETFYFTFGSGQKHAEHYQPIKAENSSKAHAKMCEVYGTAWAFDYTQKDWDNISNCFKGIALDLIYA